MHLPRILALLFTAALLLLPGAELYSQQTAKSKANKHPHVLVINSYHAGFSWTLDQNAAFAEAIRIQRPEAQLFVEFMDVKRVGESNLQESFARMLSRKYEGMRFDLVYATDDVALQFAQSYSSRLWPKGMPIIASGINNHPLLDATLHPTTRGIIETQGAAEALKLCLEQNPKARQIVMIADHTEVGREIAQQVEGELRRQTELPLIRVPTGTKAETLQFISHFDSDTIFLLALYVVDGANNYFEPVELADEIGARAKGPVYVFNDIYTHGRNCVGGYVNIGRDHGMAAGQLALMVLNGVPVNELNSLNEAPQRWVFSYPALVRHGISTSTLPEGSILRLKPQNFFTRNPLLALALFLGISAQTTLILYLLASIRRRHAATKELSRNEAQLRMLVERSPVAISIADKDGNTVLINRLYKEMIGFDISEIPNVHRIRELILPDPEYRAKVLATIEHKKRKCIQTGSSMEPVEYRLVTKYGTVLEVEMLIAEVGEYTFRITQDVTQRNRVMRELKATTDAARMASEAKSRFLANVSHEIRTPMNGIMGMVQLLRETPISPDQRDYIDTIQDSCDLLVSVINDILDLSKIEYGSMTLDKAPVDLCSFLRGIVSLANPSAESRGLAFVHEISVGLPPAIECDANRLRQVLMNMIINASKFTDKGSITLRVSASGRAGETGSLHFCIEDTGIGIPPDQLERIFEPFIQADNSATRRHGGTGLGLSICRRLVTMMGGQIEVKSELGKGSSFSFSIRAPFLAECPANCSGAEKIDEKLSEICPLRILIAEDNVVNQKVAQMMLRKMGYMASIASNGQEALEALERKGFDLVLMDVQMPIMDGLEATRRIRESRANPVHPYIIALTAHAMGDDAEKCIASGMNAHISKPLRAPILKASIVKAFRNIKDRAGDTTYQPSPRTSLPDSSPRKSKDMGNIP